MEYKKSWETTSRAVQTSTNGAHANTKEDKTEYKNLRELTCRAVQTGYKRSSNGVQTEYKRIQATTNGVQTITNGI